MRPHLFVTAFLAILVKTLVGCVPDCNQAATFSLLVTIVSGATEGPDGSGGIGGNGGAGEPMCAASVIATDGDFSEALQCYAADDDCLCLMDRERPGTYTVTATLDGGSETQTVTVEKTKCGVETEELCFFGECE